MGKANRKQFFNHRQHNLRQQKEGERQRHLDELDIENHGLHLQLTTSLTQITTLSNRINTLSTQLNRYRRRSRYLDNTWRDVVRLFVVIELAYAERRRKAFLSFYRLALSLFLFLASNSSR
ncbi:6943_t:CDS:2 [Funneliformis mosseae]|uniref:6943_t:CDS:1 n=1 Tax=Funneliformis mosseae TaxID=27381 RepID=A0A9N9BR74_FUNMO|nr:6943_t:CDS:2 [Funneliformis mosseae]